MPQKKAPVDALDVYRQRYNAFNAHVFEENALGFGQFHLIQWGDVLQ